MKKSATVFAALFALALSFSFFSCSNFSGESSSALALFLAGGQDGASSQTVLGDKSTVIFTGTIGASGAMPSEILKQVQADANGVQNGVGVAKSAKPVTSGTNFVNFARAEARDEGGAVIDTSTGTFGTGAAANKFEIPLAAGKTWKIYCGVKDTNGTPDDESDDIEVYVDFFEKDVTLDDPTLTHMFYPKPLTTGSGTMALEITLAGNVVDLQAAWLDDELAAACPITVTPVAPGNGTKTISASNIPCGKHELTIAFLDTDGAVLHSTAQTINIFAGLNTDKWVSDTSDGSDGISGGAFTADDSLVQNRLDTTLYVGNVASASIASNPITKAASDENPGSMFAPLATLQKAFDKIAAYGNPSSPYKICVSGSVRGSDPAAGLTGGAQIIPTVALKSSSILIVGLDAIGSDGTPGAAIDAGGADSALMVVASVPVTIKNVALKNARNGLSIAGSSSEVKLSGGSLVTQNKRGVSISSGTLTLDGGTISGNVTDPDSISYGNGAGVNVSGGGTFLMRSGTISGNTAVKDGDNSATGLGGGVYVLGTFKMTGGTISKNKAASGGGVCISNSASGAISGGTITENEATTQGGGVSVSAYTSITGGTISKNKAPAKMGGAISTTRIFLTLGGSAYIPRGIGTAASPLNDVAIVGTDFMSHATYMYLSSDLSKHSSSVKVGLSIPDDMWKRWQEIIKAPDGKFLPDNIENKFALTPPNSVDGWAAERSGDKKAVRLFAPIYVAADAAYNATTNLQGYRVCKTAGDNSNPGTKSKPYAALSTAVFNLKDAGKDLTVYIDGTVKGCTTVSGLSNDASNSSAWGYAKSLTISGATTFTTTATTSDRLDCLDGGLSDAEPGIGASGNTLYIMPMPVPITITSLKVTGGKSASDGGGICLNSVASGGATLTLAKDARVEGNRAVGNGAGVYVAEKATLNVLSNAYVYGNYNIAVDAGHPNGEDKGQSNVWLTSGRKINVTGALRGQSGFNGAMAKIGVGAQDEPAATDDRIVFTSGLYSKNGSYYACNYFYGDKFGVGDYGSGASAEGCFGLNGGGITVDGMYADMRFRVDRNWIDADQTDKTRRELKIYADLLKEDGTAKEGILFTGGANDIQDFTVKVECGGDALSTNYYMTSTVIGSYAYIQFYGTEAGAAKVAPVGDYIVRVSGKYKERIYNASFKVAVAKRRQPTQTLQVAPAGTDGTAGTGATYVYFGDWPQTVKAEGVTVNENDKDPTIHGDFEYCRGSDGAWYVKCKENAFAATYTYSDGSPASRSSADSYKWFKVEPIKWRVLSTSYDHDGSATSAPKWLLLAENSLTAGLWYFDTSSGTRELSGNMIYPSNWEHSKLSAYLNGESYKTDSTTSDSTYANKGFYYSAFTDVAKMKIPLTKVKNDAESASVDGGTIEDNPYASGFCWNKIFVLSRQEATKSAYFTGNVQRKRSPTDWAIANGALMDSSRICTWWLRSPYKNDAGCVKDVEQAGSIHGSGLYVMPNNNLGIVPAISLTIE